MHTRLLVRMILLGALAGGLCDRMIARELEEIKAFDLYSPIIETYIREVKPDAQMGAIPKLDYYFLGQADFRGQFRVRSMTESSRKGTWTWSFDPAGFLQMIYIDRGEFYKVHYRFKYSGREYSPAAWKCSRWQHHRAKPRIDRCRARRRNSGCPARA